MAETAAPPRPEAGKKPDADSEKIRIVLNGLDKSAEAFGREAAHNEASKNPEGPAWRRVVKSAWNNLTHEYQIVQKTQEKTEAIYEHDNVLHHYGQDDKSWREATADRYASEYGHEMLRDGETFHRLQEEGNGNAQRVRGDIIDLPEEATPIDFAYAIHSEVGDAAVGAKADGKIIPLNQPIENGQVIEIIKSKYPKPPNQDWLDFVVSTIARREIKKQLRASNN